MNFGQIGETFKKVLQRHQIKIIGSEFNISSSIWAIHILGLFFLLFTKFCILSHIKELTLLSIYLHLLRFKLHERKIQLHN